MDNSEPKGVNFLLNALNKYGRYLYMPGEPQPGVLVTPTQTILVMERIGQENSPAGESGLMLRRVTPAEPVDFLEYYNRKN
jgi:hypothetical protein